MSSQEKFSINPLNNKKYKLPSVNDDVTGIDSFLEKNKGKKVVVVQGLGFVDFDNTKQMTEGGRE